jgi:PBSX family phage terminase large subunit
MAFEWQQFSDKQLDVIFGEWAHINVLEGSVSSGKTVCSLVAWMNYLTQAPAGRLAMIGNTRGTLKRNCLDLLEDMYGPSLVQINHGTGEAVLNGREVYLFGSSDVRAEQKIRGGTWAGAYDDEGTLHSEDFFNMLLSRLRVPGAMLFLTTNPDSPAHYLYTNFILKEQELNAKNSGHIRRWSFGLADNLSLDPDYVERLKSQYVGLWYKRYIEGIWAIAEGAVYGGFLRDSHFITASEVPLITRYYVGVDYATSSFTAYVLVGLGIDNCLYVLGEYYYSGDESGYPKTDVELVGDLATFTCNNPIDYAVIDPAAKSFITQLNRSADVPIRRGFNRDVRYGIRCVSALLGANRLKIVKEACPNLHREFTAYVWDSKAALRGEDVVVKKNDHLLDALRYAIVSLRLVWKHWLVGDMKIRMVGEEPEDELPTNKEVYDYATSR